MLPGSITSLTVAILLKLGAWQPLEYTAYSALFHLRKPLPPDPRVVIICIDDNTLNALGSFPLPRRYYAQLIDTLAPAEPSVVVLDLLLSEPNPDDLRLAASMKNSGRVVLAQAWSSVGASLSPIPILQEAALNRGHIYNRPDLDGVTRQINPQMGDIPVLGIAALQAYQVVQGKVSLANVPHPLWINWLGPVNQIPQYSLLDVLHGNVPIARFRDKIVLVGATAAGLDPLITAYNRNPPASGVHLHATLISNILQHNYLHLLSTPWKGLIFLVGGSGLSAVLMYRRLTQQMAIWSGLCLGWSGLVLLLFQAGYWLPIAYPMVLFSLSTIVTQLCERLKINWHLQREIEHIWQTYCQELLVWSAVPELNLESSVPTQAPLQGRSTSQPLPPIAQLAQLAEQLGRSQSAHAAIARSLSIGLLAADWNGVVWFCNPLAVEWLHLGQGDRLQPCFIPHWLSLSEWETDLQDLQAGKVVTHELQRGDRWFEVTLEPLFYPIAQQLTISSTQKPRGVLLLLENITSRKQVEAEIRRAMTQEKELYELKSRFVTTTSHEFRTPLTIILGSAELLENYGHRWSDSKKIDHLHQIQDAVKHMMELLNDVLLLSKADAGKLKFEPRPLQLVTFCSDLIQQLQSTVGSQHQIQFDVIGVPEIVYVDEKLLRHILSNLLSNAIKYSPNHSSVDFTLMCASGALVLQICDQGLGIPAADLQHLFEPFYRATNVGTIAGTGLGLTIVKESVALHQGHITVHSEVGVGTQITVTLPLQTTLDSGNSTHS